MLSVTSFLTLFIWNLLLLAKTRFLSLVVVRLVIFVRSRHHYKQDSVKLHLGLIPWPLSIIPNPYFLSLSTVPLKKFRWGLLSLSLLLLWLSLWLLSKVKVKSTPSLRPKTWSLTIKLELELSLAQLSSSLLHDYYYCSRNQFKTIDITII